jgi:hypothetical protein
MNTKIVARICNSISFRDHIQDRSFYEILREQAFPSLTALIQN